MEGNKKLMENFKEGITQAHLLAEDSSDSAGGVGGMGNG